MQESSDLVNDMVLRVCNIGKKLKLVLDTVVLTRRVPDPVPKFLTPGHVRMDIPEFASHIDSEKLQALFGKMLYAFLLKLWTPLRFSEEITHHLNSYCAGVQDLIRDTGSTPPRDANGISVSVLEQLKRLESNLSRIEVFVLTKHNQPPNTTIVELTELRSRLMQSRISEEAYRMQKSVLLDQLVEYNLQKFRPTPFFLLASPDDSNRASVSPHMILDKTLLQMVDESVKAPSITTSTSSTSSEPRDVSIDELMALASAPVRRNSNRNSARLGSGSLPILDAAPVRPTIPPPLLAKRATVAFGEDLKIVSKPSQWAESDVLTSPFDDTPVAAPIPAVMDADDKKVTAKMAESGRHTVSFGAGQLAKLQELEKMKNAQVSVDGSNSSNNNNSSVSPRSLAPVVVEREAQGKTFELPRKGVITIQASLASTFVVANSTIVVMLEINNQAKGVKVEGLELVLRDPSFNKVLQIDNFVERWTLSKKNKDTKDAQFLFPLKVGAVKIAVPLALPFLAPVVQRSRYTLALTLTGRKIKKDTMQLSIPLAVVELLKQYEHNPAQVFSCPLDAIAKREARVVPRVITDARKYFSEYDAKLLQGCFGASLTKSDEDALALLRENINLGAGSIGPEVSPQVAATLLVSFVSSLPESIIPSTLWTNFVDASRQSDAAAKGAAIARALEDVPQNRREILNEFLSLVGLLNSKSAFGGQISLETFSPVVLRPADRSTTTMSIMEASSCNAIFQLILAQKK